MLGSEWAKRQGQRWESLGVVRQQLWGGSRQAERGGPRRMYSLVWSGRGCSGAEGWIFLFCVKKCSSIEKGEVLKWVWRSGVLKDVEDTRSKDWGNWEQWVEVLQMWYGWGDSKAGEAGDYHLAELVPLTGILVWGLRTHSWPAASPFLPMDCCNPYSPSFSSIRNMVAYSMSVHSTSTSK